MQYNIEIVLVGHRAEQETRHPSLGSPVPYGFVYEIVEHILSIQKSVIHKDITHGFAMLPREIG